MRHCHHFAAAVIVTASNHTKGTSVTKATTLDFGLWTLAWSPSSWIFSTMVVHKQRRVLVTRRTGLAASFQISIKFRYGIG